MVIHDSKEKVSSNKQRISNVAYFISTASKELHLLHI